jgi:hypothetical protein
MSLKEALGYLVQLRDLYRYRRTHAGPAVRYRQLTPEQLEGVISGKW